MREILFMLIIYEISSYYNFFSPYKMVVIFCGMFNHLNSYITNDWYVYYKSSFLWKHIYFFETRGDYQSYRLFWYIQQLLNKEVLFYIVFVKLNFTHKKWLHMITRIECQCRILFLFKVINFSSVCNRKKLCYIYFFVTYENKNKLHKSDYNMKGINFVIHIIIESDLCYKPLSFSPMCTLLKSKKTIILFTNKFHISM